VSVLGHFGEGFVDAMLTSDFSFTEALSASKEAVIEMKRPGHEEVRAPAMVSRWPAI
jgi:hypothetical protein